MLTIKRAFITAMIITGVTLVMNQIAQASEFPGPYQTKHTNSYLRRNGTFVGGYYHAPHGMGGLEQ